MSAATVLLIGAIVCFVGCAISVTATYRTMRAAETSTNTACPVHPVRSRRKTETIIPPGNVIFRFKEVQIGTSWGVDPEMYVGYVSRKRTVVMPGNRIGGLLDLPVH